jgi:hypothetical protein
MDSTEKTSIINLNLQEGNISLLQAIYLQGVDNELFADKLIDAIIDTKHLEELQNE